MKTNIYICIKYRPMKSASFNFHTPPYKLFFDKEPDYTDIRQKVDILDLLTSMTNQSLCIIDFYKNNYFYISPNHYLLFGQNRVDAITLGEKLADQIIYEQDKQSQCSFKNAIFLFFKTIDKKLASKVTIFSNHRLIGPNGDILSIFNRYKPFLFDSEGHLWMVLCFSSPSTKSCPSESYIEMEGLNRKYIFDPEKKEFLPAPDTKLTEKEMDILQLTIQGYTSKEIGEKKYISLSTVKFHKQNILKKFHVQNISEAILYARTHNVI